MKIYIFCNTIMYYFKDTGGDIEDMVPTGLNCAMIDDDHRMYFTRWNNNKENYTAL